LDIFEGQFGTQIHDFNPGFGPEVSPVGGNGFGTRTFWTSPIPDDDVTVQFAAGRAEMRVNNFALGDYTKIPIALGPNWQTAFVPATVSFDIVWSGPVTRRLNVRDGTNGNNYAGEYVENQATVTWSASEAGFSFTSNPGTVSLFAELGHERNGSFNPPDPSAPVKGIFAPPDPSGPTRATRLSAFPPSTVSRGGSANAPSLLSSPLITADSSDPPSNAAKSPKAAALSAASLGIPPAAHDQLFADLDSWLSAVGWANDWK
jgi:hypothetical protein